MINEANASSSACRLWRVHMVETSTPPSDSAGNRVAHFPDGVKGGVLASGVQGLGSGAVWAKIIFTLIYLEWDGNYEKLEVKVLFGYLVKLLTICRTMGCWRPGAGQPRLGMMSKSFFHARQGDGGRAA